MHACRFIYCKHGKSYVERITGESPQRSIPEWGWTDKDVEELCEPVDSKVF